MDDDFDIRTLPSNFVSKSQPSKVIERLKEKRKNAHNAELEEMNNKKKTVNLETEDRIRQKSDKFKTTLEKIKNDTEVLVAEAKTMSEEEFISGKYKLQNINNQILEANETRKKSVDEFYDFCAEVENQRADKFKLILNETYTKLLDISHWLPFKLEEFFQNEIVKINQITTNNFQKYSELVHELKLQIENDTKLWSEQLLEFEEKLKKYLKIMAQKKAEEVKAQFRTSLKISKSENLLKELNAFTSFQSILEGKLSQIVSVPVQLEEADTWLKEVQVTMAYLDQSAKNLVKFYKATIVIIFHRFLGELDDIKRAILDSELTTKDDIETFQSEIYTPTVEELNMQMEKEFEKLQEVWNGVIKSMEESLEETFTFIKKSSFLWDQHFLRIEEAQKLVLKDAQNTFEKNAAAEEVIENKFNMLIDKLRQGPTVPKLEKIWIEVQKTLDQMEKAFRSHSTAEIKVLDKYRGMVNSEVDVLILEIKRFLIIHPPDEERDPKKQRKRASQQSNLDIDPDENLIPRQMLFARFQVDAVKNWMFGLWEAINQYLNVGKTDIMSKAEEWIKFQSHRLQESLGVKLAFHKSRYDMIRCSVYEKRLLELNRHAERFTQHKMAVEAEIKKIKEKQKINEEQYIKIYKNFYEDMQKIDEKIINTKKSVQVRKYISIMQNNSKKTLDTVDNIVNDTNNECSKLMQDLKQSNLKFAEAMKLFAEGGNFSIDETKSLLKNLGKLEKATAKSVAQITKEERTRHAKYRGKVEGEKIEISSTIDELIQEHEHNEKTIEKILKLQNDIRTDVVSFKVTMKNPDDLLKDVVDKFTLSIGQHEYIEDFLKEMQALVMVISEQQKIILHPEPVVMYSIAAKVEATPQQKDYRDITVALFKVKPSEEQDSFMSKLNNLLYNSFQNIQAEAKEFYSKHDILLDSGKIQPTYDTFMDEILQKYKNFLIQCEICWAENASGYINFVGHFLSFKKDYLLAFENKFYNFMHQHCQTVLENSIMMLQEEEVQMKAKYQEMHGKLKPLLGHPNNRGLLESIEVEFAELVLESENKLSTILQPLMDLLAEEYENVRSNFEKTKNILDQLSADDGLPSFREQLMEQLEIKLNLMRDMTGSDQDSDSSDIEGKDGDVHISVSKQILAYMKNLDIPTQAKDPTLLSCSSSTTYQTSSEDFLNELENSFRRHTQRIADFVENKLVKFHESFQLIWASEITRILNLYNVKYDKRITPKEKKK